MNGSWMTKLDAPTSRMIPVSRRRLNAVWRIVVATSRTRADHHQSRQHPRADLVTRVQQGEQLVEQRCWSCTSPTPGAPWNELAMTSYLRRVAQLHPERLGQVGRLDVVQDGLSLNWSLNRLYACAWVSENTLLDQRLHAVELGLELLCAGRR